MRRGCKGFLLTLEGIDGSGKTTLVQRLGAWLQEQGRTVKQTFEMGDTQLGATLRTLLHTQKKIICDRAEFLLLAADRAQHFHDVVIPALTAGHIVISDRMADSSLAYQGYGRGLDLDFIQTVNKWAMQDIVPDCTIYLKYDPKKVLDRVEKRKDALTSYEQEKLAFWQRVSAGYDEMFATRTNVITIDASRTPNAVFEAARDALSKKLP